MGALAAFLMEAGRPRVHRNMPFCLSVQSTGPRATGEHGERKLMLLGSRPTEDLWSWNTELEGLIAFIYKVREVGRIRIKEIVVFHL